MAERRRIRTLELLGGRAIMRSLLTWVVVALAAIGAAGYMLPAHRVEHELNYHSNFADGGLASLAVFAGIIIVALAMRGRRFGAGIAMGVVASGGAILAVIPVVLEHFLSHVDYAFGEDLFAIGIVGLFFTGIAAAIAEPILYYTQRRALERDDPQFPVARVV